MSTRFFVPVTVLLAMAALAGCAMNPPPAPFATQAAPTARRAPGTTNGTVSASPGSGYNPETGTTAAGGE